MTQKIFDKNSTYSVIDITNALTATTDRFHDFESARGAVSRAIVKLGIQSVNGQRRNRYFNGIDAQRVFDSISHFQSKQILPSEPQKLADLITLETVNGLVYVRPEDISLITLPPWYCYFTFRGWGCLVTLRTGKRIHVKEEMHEVNRAIKEAMEAKNEGFTDIFK